MNEHFRRRFYLSGRSFATVDRRKADLDSRLRHRRKLTAGSKATHQWNLVTPVTLFQNEGRGFWISRISSFGYRDCLFRDGCSLDRWNNNWFTDFRNMPYLDCFFGRNGPLLNQSLGDGGRRGNTGSRHPRSVGNVP
ncbi:hypothetical protein PS2_022515 [Malus domestica]